MIHRRDEFRAAEVLVEELKRKVNEPDSNLTVKYSTVATSINGANKVESATLMRKTTRATACSSSSEWSRTLIS